MGFGVSGLGRSVALHNTEIHILLRHVYIYIHMCICLCLKAPDDKVEDTVAPSIKRPEQFESGYGVWYSMLMLGLYVDSSSSSSSGSSSRSSSSSSRSPKP